MSVPALPQAPRDYDRSYFDRLLRILTQQFQAIGTAGAVRGTTLNLNLDTLPTEADVATLRTGDVYRDSTASNVLKVKT